MSNTERVEVEGFLIGVVGGGRVCAIPVGLHGRMAINVCPGVVRRADRHVVSHNGARVSEARDIRVVEFKFAIVAPLLEEQDVDGAQLFV